MKKKYKNGFTLIELMVVVVISALLVVSGSVAYNRYYAQEGLNQITNEIVSYLNLSRSMAITNQKIDGFDDGLEYVAVTMKNGVFKAFPVNTLSGTGPEYFSKTMVLNEVEATSINFGDLLFAATSGKLLEKEPDPSFSVYPAESNKKVGVTITTTVDDSHSRIIEINSSGVIESRAIAEP